MELDISPVQSQGIFNKILLKEPEQIDLILNIHFDEHQEEIHNGRGNVTFGLKRGELKIELINGEVPLKNIKLKAEFQTVIETEVQEEKGGEGQIGAQGALKSAGINVGTKTAKKKSVSGANLSDADLRSANLSDANLSNANLRSADLSHADLRSADLRSADLSFAKLRNTDLSLAKLRAANLSSTDLSGFDLSEFDLSRVNLNGANLSSSDLRNAFLIEASLIGSNLNGADLNGANLSDANLSQADISFADLRNANVKNARFSNNALGISEPLKQSLIKRGAINF